MPVTHQRRNVEMALDIQIGSLDWDIHVRITRVDMVFQAMELEEIT